jgi:hypothetical protein
MVCNMTNKTTWIEPEVIELDVRETRNDPGVGFDVPINSYPDCTSS